MAQWTAYRLGALVAVVAVLAGCGADRNLASNKDLSGGGWSISVTSPAFKDGQPLPKKYTKDGENVSPPLKWSSGPTGTTGYIVIVEDPDAGKKIPALHWLVYRIPFGTNELPENASASGTLVQGKNYKGEIGYTGPDPSKGNTHRYVFQVFAVDQSAGIGPGATLADMEQAALRSALAKGKLTGTYGR